MPKVIRPEKPRLEKHIQADIRAFLAREPDVTIKRNAQAYCTFPDGHKARTGLGPGSADLIGSLRVMVERISVTTLDDGGQHFTSKGMGYAARAMGIEIKQPGEKLDPDQVLWHDEMRKRGWIVGLACSVEDAERILREARAWLI